MRRSDQYVCPGCGELVDGADAASIWIEHPLGLACLRTHRTQTCAKAAVAASEGKQRPDNLPPMSKVEKARRKIPPRNL